MSSEKQHTWDAENNEVAENESRAKWAKHNQQGKWLKWNEPTDQFIFFYIQVWPSPFNCLLPAHLKSQYWIHSH